MKKSNKKDVTINDLAVMVANGFSAVDKRFESADKSINDMDVRLSLKINEIDDNTKATRHDMLNIGDKFVRQHEFNTLLTRVGRLEEKVRTKK
ncbi:MAG TPA: hypothetical protein VJG67_03490 [Candidatus Paceibacterota bacterium]